MRSKVWWWTPPLHGLDIEREARSIYFWPIHASQHAVLTISRELWVGMKKVWLKALLLHSTPFGLLKYYSNLQLLLTRLKNFDVDLNPSSDSSIFKSCIYCIYFMEKWELWEKHHEYYFSGSISILWLKMKKPQGMESEWRVWKCLLHCQAHSSCSWMSKAAQCKHAMWARFN